MIECVESTNLFNYLIIKTSLTAKIVYSIVSFWQNFDWPVAGEQKKTRVTILKWPAPVESFSGDPRNRWQKFVRLLWREVPRRIWRLKAVTKFSNGSLQKCSTPWKGLHWYNEMEYWTSNMVTTIWINESFTNTFYFSFSCANFLPAHALFDKMYRFLGKNGLVWPKGWF